MKQYFLFLLLFLSINSIKVLPRFHYEAIQSFHSCSLVDKWSFTIYGSLDSPILPEMAIDDYKLEDMGTFTCSLSENPEKFDHTRRHKITCEISGDFERKGFIMSPPTVHGFEFENWPLNPEKKTFLMGKCGEKVELGDTVLRVNLGATATTDIWSSIRTSVVDGKLSSLPSRASTKLENMKAAMKTLATSNSFNDAEKAYLVYKWESENIQYDCYGLAHGNVDYSLDGTYSKGKGVCAGYALLYESLCDSIGLDAVYVVGYAKGASYVTGTIPTSTNHAWNAVKISGSYYLVDTTWGSGGCNGETYNKNYTPFYFCTPPERFVKSHLPADSQWQLLSNPIDLTTFANLADIGGSFYDLGFTAVSPDTAIINSSTQSYTIKLTYDSSITDILVTGHLYHLESNTYVSQSNTLLVTRGTGKTFDVKLYLNYQGQYKVDLYAGDSTMSSYPFIISFIVKTTQDATTPLYYPTVYGLYSKSDIKLITPVNQPLVQGSKVNFKLETTTYDNIYISVGSTGYFTELYKNGNVYEDTDIFIFGDKVGICTKQSTGSYSYILIYSTIQDPSSSEVATFPKAYSSPKNKLIEPIRDTLVKGKTYNFKIQCATVSKVAVIDGTWTYLTKSGDTFSGSVKITGSSGSVKISYNDGSSSSYYTFYMYNVSS